MSGPYRRHQPVAVGGPAEGDLVRVLFSSTRGYGHIFPMLPLALAFREAGHDVLWATSAEATQHVAAAGLDRKSVV